MNKTRLRVWRVRRGHQRQPQRFIVWNTLDFLDAPPVSVFRFDKGEIQKARAAVDRMMTKEATHEG